MAKMRKTRKIVPENWFDGVEKDQRKMVSAWKTKVLNSALKKYERRVLRYGVDVDGYDMANFIRAVQDELNRISGLHYVEKSDLKAYVRTRFEDKTNNIMAGAGCYYNTPYGRGWDFIRFNNAIAAGKVGK